MFNSEHEAKIQMRSAIRFLYLQGKKATEIQQDLIKSYGADYMSMGTIYYWLQKFKSGEISIEDGERSGRPRLDGLPERIKELMEIDEHISARDLSGAIGVDKMTIIRALREDLSMVKVNFRWVPHRLTPQIKQKRVEIAHQMLKTIRAQRYLGNIYTSDETWIYLRNPRRSMWTQSGVSPPTCEKRTIGSKKAMISVIWSSSGMKSIVLLPQGEKFTQEFFKKVVLGNLSRYFEMYRPSRTGSGILLHLDNASAHRIPDTFGQMRLTRLEHPPYSPDLAPSDFFLFGYLKAYLEGMIFESFEEMFQAVQDFLYKIPIEMLGRVYSEWITRLEKCIESGGEYIVE